jgi:hypothetical protein
LLQSLLGDDAGLEPLKQHLIERTQGNLFFLEESVRTLVETQVLVGDQGTYRLARALPSVQVPATVQAVLAARIDRLPPEEKQFLQTTAVIGTEVPLALLQAIAEAPEGPRRLGLAHLQATEFLYETRLFPEIEYTFKHALTQQVAYETLLQERRRALHARIVEAPGARSGRRVLPPALALADDLGMRPLVAHCHLGLGKLYARIGCRAEAHTDLSAAIELYRAMEMTFWLPQAETTLAQVEKL